MWEFLQIILNNKITPNQCLILFGIKNKTQISILDTKEETKSLLNTDFIKYIPETKQYIITQKGEELLVSLESYFTKRKKKTDIDILGKDYILNIEKYRNLFPAIKLPSGKLARQNTKALQESFRWFFDTYDYTWNEVLKATKKYIDQYKDADYMYMMTSQYFISKQDKHKVKHSSLADYCDMIREGLTDTEHKFIDKVV